MKINEEQITKIVAEELEKFLAENPMFKKMMVAHGSADGSKQNANKNDVLAQKQAEKDKVFRLAQRGHSGSKEIEFKEGKKK